MANVKVAEPMNNVGYAKEIYKYNGLAKSIYNTCKGLANEIYQSRKAYNGKSIALKMSTTK